MKTIPDSPVDRPIQFNSAAPLSVVYTVGYFFTRTLSPKSAKIFISIIIKKKTAVTSQNMKATLIEKIIKNPKHGK